MKKILIVYNGYLPGKNYGGPVASIYNFSEYLGKDYFIYIICSNHDLNSCVAYENINEGWNTVGDAKVLYLPNKDFQAGNIAEIAAGIKPDLFYASSIMSAKLNIPLINKFKKMNIPTLFAPRGELADKAIQIKKWKKIPYLKVLRFSGFSNGVMFQATSEDERVCIEKRLKVSPDQIRLIPNLPPKQKIKTHIDKEEGRVRIIFISRIVPNKNVLYAIKLVKQLESMVLFDIYGPIENKEYWEKCKKEMNFCKGNISIHYCGQLDVLQAREIYQKYDCLLMPTEFENYGQVIAESMLGDCPVVISEGTTPWDDVMDNKAGYTATIGHDEDFIKALKEISSMNQSEYERLLIRMRKYIKNKANIEAIKAKYTSVIEEICSNGGIK